MSTTFYLQCAILAVLSAVVIGAIVYNRQKIYGLFVSAYELVFSKKDSTEKTLYAIDTKINKTYDATNACLSRLRRTFLEHCRASMKIDKKLLDTPEDNFVKLNKSHEDFMKNNTNLVYDLVYNELQRLIVDSSSIEEAIERYNKLDVKTNLPETDQSLDAKWLEIKTRNDTLIKFIAPLDAINVKFVALCDAIVKLQQAKVNETIDEQKSYDELKTQIITNFAEIEAIIKSNCIDRFSNFFKGCIDVENKGNIVVVNEKGINLETTKENTNFEFDPDCYIDCNSDLKKVFKNHKRALEHYNNFGKHEGRIINKTQIEGNSNNFSTEFDPDFYIDYHPDLKKAFKNYKGAIEHYNKYGKHEGRIINKMQFQITSV